MFAALYVTDDENGPALLACAQEFSPRVETQLGGRLVLIDIAGLGRMVGDAHAIAAELGESLTRASRSRGVTVVVAPSRVAALLLAVAGVTGKASVVLPGRTAAAVGALSLDVLSTLASQGRTLPPSLQRRRKGSPHKNTRPCALCALAGAQRLCGQPGGACTELPTLRRWGLFTLGDVAALPAADLSARLGQMGVVLQRLARGLDTRPLVPVVEEARFEASLDLEWPIDDLQPLSFVLARLLEPLSAALERADRGAAALVTELTLVRLRAESTRTHVRRLELPAPMRDARVLRTLILLDLESHPPEAGIDRVAIRIEPTPARIVQFSLLERAGPQPETIATLVSRLTALMGEGRVGSPVMLDSHAPDAFALEAFSLPAVAHNAKAGPPPLRQAQGRPEPGRGASASEWANTPRALIDAARWSPASTEECWHGPTGGTCLRRFRLPVAARVVMTGDRLERLTTDRVGIKGGNVQQCAGPWLSSGNWWASAWDREEYDVALGDGAAYRIYRDRHKDRWFIEGILD